MMAEAMPVRQSAIDGLRAIAQMEEYVAAEVDGPDDWTLLALDLRDSAGRHRRLALALAHPPRGGHPRPRLHLVTANADQEAQ